MELNRALGIVRRVFDATVNAEVTLIADGDSIDRITIPLRRGEVGYVQIVTRIAESLPSEEFSTDIDEEFCLNIENKKEELEAEAKP